MAKQMTDSSSTPTHEQISRRAYEIFIERGQPAGQDLAHWLEAEKQLRAAGQPKAAASASKAPQLTTDAVRATQPAPSNGNSAAKSPGTGKTQARASARK